MLPEGSLTSRTWRGRSDDGRQAILREIPDGVTPFTPTSVAGFVPLREVTLVGGRRMTVWDAVNAESLQELIERLHDSGNRVPVGLLARVVCEASRALASISPPKPHGGLGDGALLLTPEGQVLVMDFGCPRPSRFTAAGPPSLANDVFSMGGIVHACLTGYGGMYASAVAEGLQLPKPSQLHEGSTAAIDDVVSRAISRSVEQRQPDLELFADELEAAVGPQLFTTAQVSAFLRANGPMQAMPVIDAQLVAAPIDDVPTGEHSHLGHDVTQAGQPPRIPMGTQPGRPPPDAFAKVQAPDDTGPLPQLPQATQPGVPGRALTEGPPPTRPSRPSAQGQPDARRNGPLPSSSPAARSSNPGRASVGGPPRSSAPKPGPPVPDLNTETQPRMVLPAPVPPEPAPSAISQAKLEWAETQTRVPTPPLGTPAASQEFEDDATEFGSKPDLEPGLSESDLFEEVDESTAVRPRPKLPLDEDVSSSVTNLPNAESRSSGGRKLIAVLLLVIAGLFGAAVWKKQQDARRVGTVTPVMVDEPDAGAEKLVVVEAPDAGSDDAVDAGDAELVDEGDGGEGDAGEGDDESDDGGEPDETEVADAGTADAGATDAGAKKVVKKKPPKRKRRR
jgi:hypothetical protein